MAKGFFHHNATIWKRDIMAVQPFGQISEQGRRNRKIKCPHMTIAHFCRQLWPAIGSFGIYSHIIQTTQKCLCHIIWNVFRSKFKKGLFNKLTVAVGIVLSTRGTDNLGILRYLTRDETAKQTWQNLAASKVTRSAKNHQIKRFYRNDA